MDKETIFDIFMQAKVSDLLPLAQTLALKVDYKVIKKPAKELIALSIEEGFEISDFNPGEVLVSSCTIAIGNAIGYSMVLDLDEEKAFFSAMLLAVYETDLPEKEMVEALALSLYRKREKELQKEWMMIEKGAI